MSPDIIVQEAQGLIKATDYERVITADMEGRVIFFSYNKRTYRRSLFNKYLEVGYKNGLRIARPLGPKEAQRVAQEAYRFLQEVSSLSGDLKGRFGEALANGPEFLEDDAKRFIKIYGGTVPIVPPDQYFPVYVQATVGCYWNRCTFCNLYRGKSYRVKGLDELMEHVKEVKEAFGKGLSARRSIFLGDANSLAASQVLVVGWLNILREELGLPVYSFVDAITTQTTKGREELKELRSQGLVRVYLGLESGSPKVLRLLGKPESISGAVELLRNAKDAGLTVGIIVLVGAGGRAYYKDHVQGTAEVISKIPLDRSDIVFLSPIYIYSWLPYYVEAKETGLLSFNERIRQVEDLTSAIRELYKKVQGEELKAPIVQYDLAEAIY